MQGGDREQRRAHHDEPEPGAARRRPLPPDRRQRAVLRDDARRCRRSCTRSRRNSRTSSSTTSSMRPLNAFRGFKPGGRAGAGDQRAARRVGARLSRAGQAAPAGAGASRRRAKEALDERPRFAHARAGSSGSLPFAVLALLHRLGDRLGPRARRACRAPEPPASSPQPVDRRAAARVPDRRRRRRRTATTVERTLFNPTRRPGAAARSPTAAKPTMQRGQFALTGTMVVDGKATAFLREVERRQVAPRARRAKPSTACWSPRSSPTACG